MYKNINSIFLDICQEYAENIAVDDNGHLISYNQLNQNASNLACSLMQFGYKKGDLIGLYFHRSIDLIVSILACVKVGIIFVTIDKDSPINRIKNIAESNQLKCILGDKSSTDDTIRCMNFISYSEIQSKNNIASTSELIINKDQNDLCIFFTSGTTGSPKGVIIDHKSIINLVTNTNYINITEYDVIAHTSNVAFDAISFEIWGALLNGAKLVIGSKEIILSSVDYNKFIYNNKITIQFLTTSLFNMHIKENRNCFKSLKYLLFGGEEANLKLIKNYIINKGILPQYLLNVYGPTECSTFSSFFTVDDSCTSYERLPIGIPINNCDIYIMNDKLEILKNSEPGEIIITGIGVSKGYYNDKEMTDKKFINCSLQSGNFYKTGDIGYYDDNNNLIYVSRKDRQFKINGFRIEPGEIEFTIKKLNFIEDAYVIVDESCSNQKYITLYITLSINNIDSDMIQQFIKDMLPHYMHPKYVRIIDELPVNQNGKVNLTELSSMRYREIISVDQNKFIELTSIELSLSSIITRLISIPELNVDVSIFDYGFDSLDISRFINLIYDEFKVKISVYDIFSLRTIKNIAKLISEIEVDKNDIIPKITKSDGIINNVPSQQKRIWFLHKLFRTTRNYNSPIGFSLHGFVDVHKLERSINCTINKFQSLRMSIKDIDGKPKIDILDNYDFKLTILNTENANVNTVISNLLLTEIPYDIAPLFKVYLIYINSEESILFFNFSHMIIDGWSLPIIFSNINYYYNNNVEIPLKGEVFDFLDYVSWTEKTQKGLYLNSQRLYWQNYLKGIRTEKSQSVSHVNMINKAGHASIYIDEVLKDKLTQVSKKQNVTLSAIFCASFTYAISIMSNKNEILISMPVANRRMKEFESIVGFIANTVLVYSKSSMDKNVFDFIKEIGNSIINAQDNQEVPFEELVSICNFQDRNIFGGLTDYMFVMQDNDKYNLELDNLTSEEIYFKNDIAKFNLLMSVDCFDNFYNINIEFNKTIYSDNQISEFKEYIFSSLNYFTVSNEFDKLESLCKNTKKQLRTILDSSFEINKYKTAVQDEDDYFTYEDLDILASKMAYRISAFEINEGDTIGFVMDKSVHAIVAYLACIKLKVIYFPLDKNYPEIYINKIIELAKPKIIFDLACYKNKFVIKEDILGYWNDSMNDDVRKYIGFSSSIKSNNDNYMIFTSGSTGDPKGIIITDDTIINLIKYQSERLRFLDGINTLQYSALNFDVYIQEILSSLCSGGAIVFVQEDIKKDDILLLKFIIKNNINRIYFPYIKLNSMAHAAYQTSIYPNKIRELISTGEQLVCNEYIKQFYIKQENCRFFNMYGPSETHVVCTYELDPDPCKWDSVASIGLPIDGVTIKIVNENNETCKIGDLGEILISGINSKNNYIDNLNESKYIALNSDQCNLYYRSGDIGYMDKENKIYFSGRDDQQYKISGYRVDISHVEFILSEFDKVRDIAILADKQNDNTQLHAFVVFKNENYKDDLIKYAENNLPFFLIPKKWTILDSLPNTPSGKLDRRALNTKISSKRLTVEVLNKNVDLIEQIKSIFSKNLNISNIQLDENFFEIGADSFSLSRIYTEIYKNVTQNINLIDLFRYTTINKLANYLHSSSAKIEIDEHKIFSNDSTDVNDNRIAIVGMSGKFPGALNIKEFWNNTLAMVETSKNSGLTSQDNELRYQSKFVDIVSSMDGIFDFDPDYFGISESDAMMMDPQHRHFLMGAVNALNSTGYNYMEYSGKIGVIGSCAENTFSNYMLKSKRLENYEIDDFKWSIHSEKDFIATKVSYYLNLNGPAYTVQSGCSSSLVSINLACSQLYNNEADMMLVGGIAIDVESQNGYQYIDGHIYSPDGHCRPFDEKSNGTYSASGYGFVVLKKLSNALRDNDVIYSVIESSSINNDGKNKVGYSAPSISGQVDVLKEAIKRANISPFDISYIEAHGTATKLGDAVEISALKEVFQWSHQYGKYCAVSSLKSQIGHMAAASGIAGLIRVSLSLFFEKLPANINFTELNSNLDLANSGLYINSNVQEWKSDEDIKYAGVSSFGIGGTNAHVILSNRNINKEIDIEKLRIMKSDNIFQLKKYNSDLMDNHKNKIRPSLLKLYERKWVRYNKFNDFIAASQLRNKYVVCFLGENINIYQLEHHNYIIKVYHGNYYQYLGNNTYVIDYKNLSSMIGFLTEISNSYSFTEIFYFSTFDNKFQQVNEIVDFKVSVFYPYLYLVQACDRTFNGKKLKLTLLTKDLYLILGEEEIKPNSSLLVGAMNVFKIEYNKISFNHIDIDTKSLDNIPGRFSSYLSTLINYNTIMLDDFALRNGYIWKNKFINVNDTPDAFSERNTKINDILNNGVYVILGGTGELGIETAKFLSEKNSVKIIIISRHSYYGGNDRIDSAIKEIMKNGSTVEFVKCDITYTEKFQFAMDQIFYSYKKIDGLFHSAGIPDMGASYSKTPDSCENVIKLKVDSLILFERFIELYDIKLIVVYSSVVSYTGEFGQLSYCSSNYFSNNYIEYLRQKYVNRMFVCIAWDTWKEGGMAHFDNIGSALKHQLKEISFGISRLEGRTLLEYSLNLSVVNLIVSNIPIYERKNLLSEKPIIDSTVNKITFVKEFSLDSIKKIFSSLLCEKVGNDSDFFSLGGDSLLAISIVSELNDKYSINISLREFMENSTPLGIYEYISRGDRENFPSVIEIFQKSKSTIKLYLLPPIGGGIGCYNELVKHLTVDIEIVGLRDPSLIDNTKIFNSFHEKINYYKNEIKNHQKNGTYIIGGWSLGGMLAHQLAKSMTDDGDIVAFAFMIDPPDTSIINNHKVNEISNRIIEKELTLINYEFNKINSKSADDSLLKILKLVIASNLDLIRLHEIKPDTKTKQLIFSSNDSDNEKSSLFNQWRKYCGDIVNDIPVIGDHYTILNEFGSKKIADFIIATIRNKYKNVG